jgi:hypothetical protein
MGIVRGLRLPVDSRRLLLRARRTGELNLRGRCKVKHSKMLKGRLKVARSRSNHCRKLSLTETRKVLLRKKKQLWQKTNGNAITKAVVTLTATT